MRMVFEQPLVDSLDFELPPELAAAEPPEARGLTRDAVRLMVSYQANDRIEHTQFHNFADYLQAGDVLVINTSGTMKAAVKVQRADGTPLRLHLSTQLPNDLWVVELRTPMENSTQPFFDGVAGETLQMPDGAMVQLLTAHDSTQRYDGPADVRLWIAAFDLPMPLLDYLEVYGMPIRYQYVAESWPASYYQTVYATDVGSAEMPSAGRAFTSEIITQLVSKGVQIAPLVLHTGVASQERHEAPYEEYYCVPTHTAALVNATRQHGGRVVAVGTTVVRALETVTRPDGHTRAGEGWTHLFITPERGVYGIDGMLTGLHEPKATHLAMLESVANRPHLQKSYAAALEQRYLWHEFGDLHLILP